MEFKLGWSAEINGSWVKMDVSVDETDLLRIVTDHGLDSSALERLRPTEAFTLLESLGEKLVLVHQIHTAPENFKTPDNLEKLNKYKQAEESIIEKLLNG